MKLAERFDEVLVAARQGRPEAWLELYDDVAPLVLGYLRGQGLPEPEDTAGEVMLQVVRDLEQFGGDHRNFRSWVLTISHHRLLDARRRAQRRPTTPMQDLDIEALLPPDTEWRCSPEASSAEVERMLEPLTEEQRSIVLLRVVADLTIEQTAGIVGKTPGAVKALQHRAVSTLRREMAVRT